MLQYSNITIWQYNMTEQYDNTKYHNATIQQYDNTACIVILIWQHDNITIQQHNNTTWQNNMRIGQHLNTIAQQIDNSTWQNWTEQLRKLGNVLFLPRPF